ncbi:MAG: aryl-sulfate sulfotransferase [Proteobacteria bacterium]|nr:aryl-sulfate sulfotransferase [Pseudomonadota bacterium]
MTDKFAKILTALLLSSALVSCGDTDQPLPELLFNTEPAVSPVATLAHAWELTVSTNLFTAITAVLDDGMGHAYTIEFGRQQRDHVLTVLGMRPDRTYTVNVTAHTLDGITLESTTQLQVTTPPLPANFPVISLLSGDPALMEPGFTLMDTGRKDGSAAFIVIVDDAAEVVWYFQTSSLSETERVASGEFLSIDEGSGLIQFINERGEVVNSLHSAQSHPATGSSIPVDVAEFHDEVVKHDLFSQYFTSIRDASRTVDNFPLDENDPLVTGTVNVLDEPIIEIDLDGNILNRWDFLDMLKPTRIGYDGTSGLPAAADWAHVNSIAYDVTTDNLIVSLKHQDAVVNFSRADGTLIWILGNPANWQGFEQFLLTPDGGVFAWPYHQHAVEITGDNLIMFDNGNRRASPFTGEPIVSANANSSRAVEYAIDTDTMIISQVWEWGLAQSGESLYSSFAGDADRLPLGNTLITFGGLCEENGVPSENLAICRSSARVIEVDTTTGAKVFDISIDDADPLSSGYIVNRSERLRVLYSLSTVTMTVP